MTTGGHVLGIFAKEPTPGRVKTRLAEQTSPDWAAQVARAFLLDTLRRCAAVDARRVVVFAPPEGRAAFAELVQGRYVLEAQAAGSLGERLRAFIAGALAGGAERVVVLGADSPTLPVAFVEQAFEWLATSDVVLGPATDGGYYLLGCGRKLPPVFDGIGWSSPRVLEQTIQRLHDLNWRVSVLPPWYDIDTLDDWQLLRGHVAALRRAGVDPGVPEVEAFM